MDIDPRTAELLQGFKAKKTQNVPAHVIYTIGNEGELVVMEDHRSSDPQQPGYVEILAYPSLIGFRYAALLDLY